MTRFCGVVMSLAAFCSAVFGQGVRAEWTKRFPTDHPCGFTPVATVDQKDNLWLVCPGFASRETLGSLLRIDGDGELVSGQELRVKLPDTAKGEVTNVALASGRSGTIGVLMSLTTFEGRVSYFEGAFFAAIKEDGLGTPVRVSAAGPQFLELIAYDDGGFLAAGDQEPLTLIRLRADGGVIWRRNLSKKLVLGQLATVDGNVYLVSQGGDRLAVQRFSPKGALLGETSVIAKQGSVIATGDGNIAILYSDRHNRVHLTELDKRMRTLWTVPTPLLAKGGRTYQLIADTDGFVAAGDAEPPGLATLIGVNRTGTIVWRNSIPIRVSPPGLLKTQSGFYMVSTDSQAFEVTKMVRP